MVPIPPSQPVNLAQGQDATHLPVELWLRIVSYIHHDRADAWFKLRLVCRMSKIAIEDVCARYFLPHMRLINVEGIRAGIYCFTGLVGDGGMASFCKYASDMLYHTFHANRRRNTGPPTIEFFSSRPPVGPVPSSEMDKVRFHFDGMYTRIDGNPYCLSTHYLQGRSIARQGLPWKHLLSMVLGQVIRRRWDAPILSRQTLRDTVRGDATPSILTGATTFVYIPNEKAHCDWPPRPLESWEEDLWRGYTRYSVEDEDNDRDENWWKATRGSLTASHRRHGHWEFSSENLF
jgi:hypothetical protein